MSGIALARAYARGRQRIREQNAEERQASDRRFRPVLVPTNCVIERLGIDVDSVHAMVDSGRLLWVFNVSTNPASRSLRFWLGELLAPELQRSLPVETVIQCIVGHELFPDLSTYTVEQILFVRRQIVFDLHVSGELRGRIDGHVRWTTRESLVSFLSRRWLGC